MTVAKRIVLARGVTLPLDVVTQTLAIIAKRRVGKSFTARRLAEQIYKAGEQIAIVDPKGDHWGIRSAADGKGPGLPIVILGGEHGDVPLEVGSGEIVAKLIVEDRVSALLDLSLLRKHEIATFMTAYLETLYRLKAREQYRTPLMLIVDEADAIMPQKPQPNEARMLGAGEDIVRRGGQRGIGVALVTQRSAVLNKNVLTQAEMLIALRTIAPQDRDALEAWIDVHGTKEQRDVLMESLGSLPKGDAWFWSPGWPTDRGIFTRAHVLPIETFDSGKSPEAGEKRVAPKQLADVDLAALSKQMSATIERAKADDPRELRKQIVALNKQAGDLAADLARAIAKHEGKSSRADVAAVKREELQRAANAAVRPYRKALESMMRFVVNVRALNFDAAGIKKEDVERTVSGMVDKLTSMLDKQLGERAAHLARLRSDAEAIVKAVKPLLDDQDVQLDVVVAHRDPIVVTQRPAAIRTAATISGGGLGYKDHGSLDVAVKQDGDLGQQIVDTLGSLADAHIETVPVVNVAAFAGYHPRTPTFIKALRTLEAEGVIERNDGKLRLLLARRRSAGGGIEIKTRDDLHRALYRQLKEMAASVLRLVIANPHGVSVTDVANELQYHPRTPTFIDAIKTLDNLGLVDRRNGVLTPTAILFPAELR